MTECFEGECHASKTRLRAGDRSMSISTLDADDLCVPGALGSFGATLPLIGREAETDQLDALIEHLGGGALVISGEAGIGKSALLEHALGRASEVGAQTLVTVGVESEVALAFAGMHQLL